MGSAYWDEKMAEQYKAFRYEFNDLGTCEPRAFDDFAVTREITLILLRDGSRVEFHVRGAVDHFAVGKQFLVRCRPLYDNHRRWLWRDRVLTDAQDPAALDIVWIL